MPSSSLAGSSGSSPPFTGVSGPDLQRAMPPGVQAFGKITNISRALGDATSSPAVSEPANNAQPSGASEGPAVAEVAEEVWRIIRRRLQVERERERGFS